MDPIIGGALISGGAGLLGGVFGSSKSAQSAKEAAEISRDWEREKLKNAYQYTVQDLKAAGLNPILAVQNGPNTAGSINTPMPDYSGLSAAGAAVGQSINNAINSKLKKKLIEVQKTGIDSQINKNLSDIEVNKQNVINAKEMVTQIKLQNDMLRAQLPSAQNVATYRNSDFGKAMQYIGLSLGDVQPLLGPISYGIGGYMGARAGTAAGFVRQGQALKRAAEQKTRKIPKEAGQTLSMGPTAREYFEGIPTYLRGQMRY